MFYYLYEVRNNINGKIYVGVHKTRDLNDGYMGSGKVLNRSMGKIWNLWLKYLDSYPT